MEAGTQCGMPLQQKSAGMLQPVRVQFSLQNAVKLNQVMITARVTQAVKQQAMLQWCQR